MVDLLGEVLDKHRGVEAETHKKHHEFIDLAIEDIERKKTFWLSVRKQVFGWGIIMMLSGAGLAVADWMQHVLKIK